jgi:hypothetical protein
MDPRLRGDDGEVHAVLFAEVRDEKPYDSVPCTTFSNHISVIPA